MVDTRLKHILYGAGVQLGSKFTSNAVFNAYQKKSLPNPAPWWYTGFYGYPLDDVVLDLGLPAVLGVAGVVTKKPMLKDMAIGSAISGIATFLSVFMARTSMYPWLPFKANSLYAGPENPQPSPFAPPASPQAQLTVGCTGSGGKVVYKTATAGTCPQAGMHAADTQLFI